MKESHQSLEEALFELAVQKPTAEERAAFLGGVCRDNSALRSRLEVLLEGHFKGTGFLQAAESELKAIPAPQIVESPAQMIGRYKLLEKIGEGGFGEVWMAEQHEPVKRRVALKIIKLGMDSRQVVARFEAERQALAMMDHPNIAKVFDAGATDTGRPYFVMELVRGVKIADYCDNNALPTYERLKLFVFVCQAIQHAHQKGIIHRDIKPSNILVTLHDGVPVPKVIDFGIAKATQGELTDKTVFTQFQQFIGTPAYISPEQAEMSGLDIDTRADIYSLGVVLYELLVGQTPFDAKEMMKGGLDALRKTIREQEPLRPSTKLKTLPAVEVTTRAQRCQTNPSHLTHQLHGDLDWIVMKCLEKDRARRYQTANDLAADLKRYLANEPIVARPPSAAYQLQKAWQRNRLAFSAGATVAVALIVGIGVSTWQAVVATRARASAETAKTAEKEQRLATQHHLYVANMSLAQLAWEQNNVGRLRRLLDDTRASPDRGFEWYYWQRQTHLALQTLRGHRAAVPSVAFSPDGQRIVTGSVDQTAKVWDTASGRELVTLKNHSASIRTVAFSSDGRRIVTGSDDQTAKVWEAASGKELLTLNGHSSAIFCVAFSPDGQRIATGSDDQAATVWDAASGRALLNLKGHSVRVLALAFSPDTQRLVTGSSYLTSWPSDQTAKVWDVASGRELLTLNGHSGPIYSVAFSPDGQRIITGSVDKTAKVWDAASGQELVTLRGHTARILSVAFSLNGQRIVTGGAEQIVKLWDATNGREFVTLVGHSGPILSVAFSPDGRRIVTGSLDQTANVWDADRDLERLTLLGHSNFVTSVAFSSNGQWIVTGSVDQTAKVWEAASGRELLTLRGHTEAIRAVAFSRDDRRIVTGSADQTAKVWEAATGQELLTLKGHSASIRSVTFSPDGQQIVTASEDQTAKLWDAASGQELLTLKGHSSWLLSVAFSPDGRRIATSSKDKTIKVWDAASGRELLMLNGHNAPVLSVSFSREGQRMATGSADQTVKVWETASGKELLTLQGHNSEINSVAFSPDGQRIVSGSDDGTAKVWEAASGKELLTLKGHSAGIWSVAFSPDNHRIVTGSSDRTARVWEAARAEQVAVWQLEEPASAK